MKILYVALKYDYGDTTRGLSFEHYNFFNTLWNMGHDIIYFDFMTILNKLGQEGMNKRLLDVAKAEQPDLMFTFMFTDQFEPRAIRRISRTDTVTLNWFADDHWRFETFSRTWAPNFNWVVTTAPNAVAKYAASGYRNAIKSQWACNHYLYRKLDVPLSYDVTFVGQRYGDRPAIIQRLRDAGVDARVWGFRWEAGRLSQEEMMQVFNQSRINLNLPNASRPASRAPTRAERVAGSLHQHWIGRLAKRPIRPLVRAARGTRRSAAPLDASVSVSSTPSVAPAVPDQIKGRTFEVPGCGGFLLTGRADELEGYYIPGEEVACFSSPDELVDTVIHYLEHEDERASIAMAGHERTLREHTYAVRFNEIFRTIGLDTNVVTSKSPGDLLEVT